MKAIVYRAYDQAKDVVNLEDVDRPIVRDDEVLIRVAAAPINPYDWHIMTGKPYVMRVQFGLRTPPGDRLGADLAGSVATVGKLATRFRVGDEAFGMVNGGVPAHPELALGSLAQFVAVSEQWLALKPGNATLNEAASVPAAAITALQGLRDYGDVQPGQNVLINGASGGVGTFAVQIAKSLGADVTGVCSAPNVEMVRSIGADRVIDYTAQDFTVSKRRYDLVLDNVGNRRLTDVRRVMVPDGLYLASFGQPEHDWLGPLGKLLRMRVFSRFVGQSFVQLDQTRKVEDIGAMKGLIEAGDVTPVVDRTYPLNEVAEAMDYLEQGHAKGKIVITIP